MENADVGSQKHKKLGYKCLKINTLEKPMIEQMLSRVKFHAFGLKDV